MAWRMSPKALRRAFSRVDLIATIGVVVCSGIWLGFSYLGERGRMVQCAGNLRALGQAMHSYAGEHQEGLPAAGIALDHVEISWDALVVQYLNLRSANTASRSITCPSDPLPRNVKSRSYAMAGNDMTPEHWPPGPESATGVGLWWDKRTVLALANKDALQKLELLPVLKLSGVPEPADTLLLTEFIDPNNTMGNPRQTTVFGTSQQQQFFDDGGARFHNSRFNYLMVDGHVELLSPLQTGSFDGTAGIWTLKKRN